MHDVQWTMKREARQVVDRLNKEAWERRFTDPLRALQVCEHAYQLAQSSPLASHPYLQGMAQSLRQIGYLQARLGDFGAALSYLFEALELCINMQDIRGQADVFYNLGATYRRLGNYPDSLEHLLNALKLVRQIDLPSEEARVLSSLGNIYSITKDYAQAISTYQTSLQLFQRLGNQGQEGGVLNNMAMMYLQMGDEVNALACGEESLRIARKNGNPSLELHVLDTLGRIYFERRAYTEALTYLHEALRLAYKRGNRYIEGGVLLYIGKVYWEQRDIRLALSVLYEALVIAQEMDEKASLFECHRLLAEIYEFQGNLPEALNHYKRFHEVKAEVFNEKAAQKVKTLHILHDKETANKETEIYQLKNVALEREIQERKQAEADLVAAYNTLQEKNRQLHELNAGKDKFFSIISHDLKNSFTTLLCFAEILMEDLDTYPLEKIQKLAERVHHSAEQLYALLENLLTWSRLQKGIMEYFPVPLNLSHLFENNIKLFQVHAEQKGITLASSYPQECWVVADYNMVNTILRNLLGNALKFTASGGRVELSAGQKAECMEIVISDTGVGIQQEQLEQLFRIDVKSTQPGTAGEQGTGLGLILCKELIERNDGRLQVESEVGKGTSFTFSLPAHTVPAHPMHRKAA